jgi:hypothetical protein
MVFKWVTYDQNDFNREQLHLSVQSAKVYFPNEHFVIYSDEPRVTDEMVGDLAEVRYLDLTEEARQELRLFSKWYPFHKITPGAELFIDRDCIMVGPCDALAEWLADAEGPSMIIARDRPGNRVYGTVVERALDDSHMPAPINSGIVGQRDDVDIGQELHHSWWRCLTTLHEMEHGTEQGAVAAIAVREKAVMLDETYAICSPTQPRKRPVKEYNMLHFTWGERNEEYRKILPNLKDRCGMRE